MVLCAFEKNSQICKHYDEYGNLAGQQNKGTLNTLKVTTGNDTFPDDIWKNIYSFLLDPRYSRVNIFTYNVVHSVQGRDARKTLDVFFTKIVQGLSRQNIPRQTLVNGGGTHYNVYQSAANTPIVVVVDTDFITLIDRNNLKPLTLFPMPKEISDVEQVTLSDNHLGMVVSEEGKLYLSLWTLKDSTDNWQINPVAKKLLPSHIKEDGNRFSINLYIDNQFIVCASRLDPIIRIYNLKKLNEEPLELKNKIFCYENKKIYFSTSIDSSLHILDLTTKEEIVKEMEPNFFPSNIKVNQEHNLLLTAQFDTICAYSLEEPSKLLWKNTVANLRPLKFDNMKLDPLRPTETLVSLHIYGNVISVDAYQETKEDFEGKVYYSRVVTYLNLDGKLLNKISMSSEFESDRLKQTSKRTDFLYSNCLDYGLVVDCKEEEGSQRSIFGAYGLQDLSPSDQPTDKPKPITPLTRSFGFFALESISRLVAGILLPWPFSSIIEAKPRETREMKIVRITVNIVFSLFHVALLVEPLTKFAVIHFLAARVYFLSQCSLSGQIPEFTAHFKNAINLILTATLHSLKYFLPKNHLLKDLSLRFNPMPGYEDWKIKKIRDSFFTVHENNIITEEQKKKLEEAGCLKLCPITRKPIVKDPVTLGGVLYERSAIELYLNYYGLAPQTQKQYTVLDLKPDTELAAQIKNALG